MSRKTSHARLVQRKTGAGYQKSLMKVRAMNEAGTLPDYLRKVRELPDSPVTEREHTRCVHCLGLLYLCTCESRSVKT